MEAFLITAEFFKKRIVALFLRSGLSEFPTKRRDQLIILKSIILGWDEGRKYSEAEVNGLIRQWLAEIGLFPGWDHLMLRRSLVDERFLTRAADGSCYQLDPGGPPEVVFQSEISALNLMNIITEGKRDIARKKAFYQQREAASNPTKGVEKQLTVDS
jgi:hypothetical protein